MNHPGYAEVAIHTPVRGVFTYHIPPHLEGKIEVGHLVRVAFGTAMQPGIVTRLSDWTEVAQTKPIEARLDPQPVLTLEQILLSEWMSERYLAPVGYALWLWLPPGLAGHSDLRLTLAQPEALPQPDPLQTQILALLKRRGILRLRQLKSSISDANLEKAVKALMTIGVIDAEPVLSPPGVRPQTIQTAALAIHPATIPDVLRYLGHKSRRADLLETVADLTRVFPEARIQEVLATSGSSRSTLKKLADEEALVEIDGDFVRLAIPPEEVDSTLITLRKADTDLRVLRVLAREAEPMDVSWIYAQTGAKLADLKRLADLEFVLLGEKHTWRDSLAERDFVPVAAPKLTSGQAKVWGEIEAGMKGNPTPTLPVNGEGVDTDQATLADNTTSTRSHRKPVAKGRESGAWRSPGFLWEGLKSLAREKRHDPTPAEDALWQQLRDHQVDGFNFRRQHSIDHFIVDFYCSTARLVIEIDGDIHQYTADEDVLRQAYLEDLGFTVIHFTNDEVLQSVSSVLNRIRPYLSVQSNASSDSDTDVDSSPSPFTGRGQGVGYNPSLFLLHGVTGSGKTEIYLRAIDAALQQGRQAIFLVPEIALTAQTIRRVAARFPGKVAVIHSKLSEGERYDTWRRCREGLVGVVVGTRSALFAPLPDVGCICIDEEHDDSYKNIASPHFDAREVAEYRMLRNSGVLILGSATPDILTFNRAQDADDPLVYLHLPDRIMGHRTRINEQMEREGLPTRYHEYPGDGEALTIELPPVTLVDMRDELKAGNTSMFSRALTDALTATLHRNEQAILLLNRRGASTYVFCRDCGYVLHCPRCDSPLTFHQYSATLRCHHCGYEGANVTVCPNCKSNRIKFFGAGTQQVEAEVQKLFPRARIVRWDSDTASNPEMHDAILGRFLEHQADVMVGTQLVAKGLDLPRVTLVGVVSADTGLNLPDFRAGERTFQLLTQVAGRAGRALPGGQVILQTYQPDHYAIRAASKHDYAGFYAQELQFRRELGYPPFRRLARIQFHHPQEVKARDEARRAAAMLQQRIQDLGLTATELIGPAPCFFSRVNDQYRWHLLIRGADPARLLEDIEPSRGWYIDLDPVDLL